MVKSLKELRTIIEREVPYVDHKPYSHDIIGLTLSQIANNFGYEEAKKAIRDFGLAEFGWCEQTEE